MGDALKAFEGAALTPDVFRYQLSRNFGLKLSKEEVGEVVKTFDKNNDGLVGCSEFLYEFFRLGKAYRERQAQKVRHQQQRTEAKLRKKHEDEDERLAVERASVVGEFTEADLVSAMEKVTAAASKYDRTRHGSVGQTDFLLGEMEPCDFKEMLRRSFNVKLTKGELGAVMHIFDKDWSGRVDGGEFMTEFFRLGREEESKRIEKMREREHRRQCSEREAAKLAEMEQQRQDSNQVGEFTGKDVQHIVRKLGKVAMNWDTNRCPVKPLKDFECKMTPVVFKHQLRKARTRNPIIRRTRTRTP